jgi:hypothetical protein
MKRQTRWRIYGGALFAAGVLLTAQPASAKSLPVTPFTLVYEREGLDLDTGMIVPVEPDGVVSDPSSPQPDFVVTYNAERPTCAVISQNQQNNVEIAFLDNVAFNLVDPSDLAGLNFSTGLIDEPFETRDSIVLRTDTGVHYLLGNPIEEATRVTFDSQVLHETTAGLVRSEGVTLARVGATTGDPQRSINRSAPPAVADEDWRQIRRLLEASDYGFQPIPGQDDQFTTRNDRHGLRADLDPSGFRLSSLTGEDWNWNLQFTAYGYGGKLRDVGPGQIVAEGNRIEHRRGDLIEWYVNEDTGLEQGFTLASPPLGERSAPLSLKLRSTGSLSPTIESGTEVRLIDSAGKTVLRYAGLIAWDSTGEELIARLTADADGLTIEVDDGAAIYPITIDPSVIHEDAKLTAGDGSADDWFGRAVAVGDQTALIGAYRHDAGFVSRAGAAYLFGRDGTSWTQLAELTASDGVAFDSFGISVAFDGDTALVGSWGGAPGAGRLAGSAYVFVREGDLWSQQAKLTASDASARDLLGWSVAISGDTAVLGARNTNHGDATAAGSAYIFVRHGTTWSEQAKLIASDASSFDVLGDSVGISGDTVLLGAPLDDHEDRTNAGSAYIFVRHGTTWSEQAKLIASDASSFDVLGDSVGISGDTVLLGSPLDDQEDHTNAGSAYIFVRHGTTWSEQAKLTASDASAGNLLASSVSLSGDTAILGSPTDDHGGGENAGSAYVFVRTGSTWSEQAKLIASDAATAAAFGFSVALSNDSAVVGASTQGTGTAYSFLRTGETWSEKAVLASSDPGESEFYGASVAISGTTVLVGAFLADTSAGLDAGAAFVHRVCDFQDTTPPQLSVTLTPATLWPPYHQMVDISATVTVSDDCSTPSVVLTSLTSSEPDNATGIGDGNTTGDVELGADDLSYRVRSERSGEGHGRTYNAIFTATDGSGNVTTDSGFVFVPHDQGEGLEIEIYQGQGGTLVSWPAVTGAEFYDVIRGQLNNIRETSSEISLGPVACIEANSIDENTVGWEDQALPLPGQVFFYLAEYFDGSSSTYGTESVGKPRVPSSGDCL